MKYYHYSANQDHCFIYLFSTDGEYLGNLTLHKEISSLNLKKPFGLTIDSNGFIYILLTDDHCICIFDKIGNCTCCFEPDNQLKFLHGIAIGPNGNIYVSNI